MKAIGFKFGAAWLVLVLVLLGAAAGTARAASCTPANGQALIDAGEYARAVKEFSCVIDGDPTGIEGYRGRIEARLLLGQYAEALRDYTRVTAFVIPVNPNTAQTILAGYAARLSADPGSIPALTGESFANWYFFKYAAAIHTLNHLLAIAPDSVYGTLFRGSSRLLLGATKAKGIADLEYALQLAPASADVRFIVADAYTYGLPDPQRAFDEASLALAWGLDTPRVHAILASAHLAFGDLPAAAAHVRIHIDQVTTELASTGAIAPGDDLSLPLAPGRTYAIPVPAAAGQHITVSTGSRDFYDTILVLLDPAGNPVYASDDDAAYFAAIDWTAPSAGTYLMLVTSFESVSTGELTVSRD